jgi:hypothetical protein
MRKWRCSCTFLTSALDWGEWSFSRPGRFIQGERTRSSHWSECSVCPRAGLDTEEKRRLLPLSGIEPYPFQLVARYCTDWAMLSWLRIIAVHAPEFVPTYVVLGKHCYDVLEHVFLRIKCSGTKQSGSTRKYSPFPILWGLLRSRHHGATPMLPSRRLFIHLPSLSLLCVKRAMAPARAGTKMLGADTTPCGWLEKSKLKTCRHLICTPKIGCAHPELRHWDPSAESGFLTC